MKSGIYWTDEMKESIRQKKLEYYKNNVPINKGKKLEEIFGEKKAKEISEKISKFASTRIGEKMLFLENITQMNIKIKLEKEELVNIMNKTFHFI